MKVIALNNQNLLDIAIQEYGTIEAIFDLALANGLSVHHDIAVGNKYAIPKSSENKEILNYYQKQQIKPSTALIKAQKEIIPQQTGIGYMIIGSTFIIG